METTQDGVKHVLILVESDGIRRVDGVSEVTLTALEHIADLEHREGWVSTWLAKTLRSNPSASDLEVLATDKLEQADSAYARGRRQAALVIGHAGWSDPIPQALGFLASWLSDYLGWDASKAQVVELRDVKPRKNLTDTWEAMARKLEGAADAAGRWHPDWPEMTSMGVVRLHPRSSTPTTCVAVCVAFDGVERAAIAWPVEDK